MNDKAIRKLKDALTIFDGAMGTEIYRRNFFVNTSYEQLNLTSPGIISDIHQCYLNAGAEVITTNTFAANPRKLERFGLGTKCAEINRAGVELAKKAALDKALVAASIGPAGESDSDSDTRTKAELLAEQANYLLDADMFIFESIRHIDDLTAALEAMKNHPEKPFILSLSPEDSETLAALCAGMDKAVANGAPFPAALGLNCGNGPEATLEDLGNLLKLTKLPVIVQPNAGAPRQIDDRKLYMTSAEYFSTYARRYAEMGASGIGGCCGITPEHISEMARALKPLLSAVKSAALEINEVIDFPAEAPDMAECSDIGRKLAAGEFVRTVEITPPQGFDFTKTIEGAELCKKAGIDAVNLPDGPRASARITPLATAITIERETGIATIPHCCCRDRSLLGLQAELLAYAGCGIKNMLFITGDPPKLGDYPFSSGVFDTDAIGLVKIQYRMNRGIDLGGKKLNAPTRILIGVGADPNAIEPEREYRRLAEKVESGAHFIVTQPIFSVEVMEKFLDKIASLKTPVIAGIWPLSSLRNAEFMRTQVPGVTVPDKIMRRMADARGREEQRDTGIAIARETLETLMPRIQGAQVSAPFGNVAAALQVFGL